MQNFRTIDWFLSHENDNALFSKISFFWKTVTWRKEGGGGGSLFFVHFTKVTQFNKDSITEIISLPKRKNAFFVSRIIIRRHKELVTSTNLGESNRGVLWMLTTRQQPAATRALQAQRRDRKATGVAPLERGAVTDACKYGSAREKVSAWEKVAGEKKERAARPRGNE